MLPQIPDEEENVFQLLENDSNSTNSNVLTDKEYKNLYLSLQLLRITQLRYIVQKYSLPASGNKNKLVCKVLSIFDSMRYTPFLRPIFEEVTELAASQYKPFVNPFNDCAKITPVHPNSPLFAFEHPFIQRLKDPPLLGPLFCQKNFSNGTFIFIVPAKFSRIMVFFSGEFNIPSGFSLKGQINGHAIMMFEDDIDPTPIDRTEFVIGENKPNSFVVESVVTKEPIFITIEACEELGMNELTNRLRGKVQKCGHIAVIDAAEFLSKAIATGDWRCPICSALVNKDALRF